VRTKIAGGQLRGRRVEVPAGARPTEQRVREALFSIWSERLSGARLLDLFAGSGVVGVEAVGRGAAFALLVDSDRRSLRALSTNRELAEAASLEIRRLVLPSGLARLAHEEAGRFDLIFADPPYRFRAYAELISSAATLLTMEGELALQHSARVGLPTTVGSLTRVACRRYGDTSLSFYRRGVASGLDSTLESAKQSSP
jgi:16S rRNA (guanine966-N2)-methyltransferase